MKRCNTCNTTKELDEFYPKAASKDGYMSKCKECSKAAKRAWAKANRNKLREYDREYYKKPEYKAYQKAYMKKHQQENKAYWNAKNSKYRADKLQQTPSWLDEEQLWIIQEFYDLAQLRTEATGVLHHVDHILPLNGRDVSGLHVPENLQVMPWYDNLSKSNKLEEIISGHI